MPRGKLFGFIDLANVWAMYFTVFAILMSGEVVLMTLLGGIGRCSSRWSGRS